MNESPLTLALGAALFSMMALFVVFGNIKKIADVFQYESAESARLAERCFFAVLLSTAWKSCCAVVLLGTALWLAIWADGNSQQISPAWFTLALAAVGGIAGFVIGILTALCASLACKRGAQASQLAATIGFLGQIAAFVVYSFVR